MNSPVADANAAIITELKKFMETAVLDFPEKAKYVMETGRDFTRTRILSFPAPALMIPDTLKRSLSIAIRDFFHIRHIREEAVRSRPSANSGAN